MARRVKADPEAVLAKIRRLDHDVGLTSRVDVQRMSPAAAAKFLRKRLREMKAGRFVRPWWLVDGASSVTA